MLISYPHSSSVLSSYSCSTANGIGLSSVDVSTTEGNCVSSIAADGCHSTAAATAAQGGKVASCRCLSKLALAMGALCSSLFINACTSTDFAQAFAQFAGINSNDLELKKQTLYCSYVYEDFVPALLHYYAFNRTTFAVYADEQASDMEQRNYTALADVLQQNGAAVCRSSVSCDARSVAISTTHIAADDTNSMRMVNVSTDKISLSRMYSDKGESLGPMSVLSQRRPLYRSRLTKPNQYRAAMDFDAIVKEQELAASRAKAQADAQAKASAQAQARTEAQTKARAHSQAESDALNQGSALIHAQIEAISDAQFIASSSSAAAASSSATTAPKATAATKTKTKNKVAPKPVVKASTVKSLDPSNAMASKAAKASDSANAAKASVVDKRSVERKALKPIDKSKLQMASSTRATKPMTKPQSMVPANGTESVVADVAKGLKEAVSVSATRPKSDVKGVPSAKAKAKVLAKGNVTAKGGISGLIAKDTSAYIPRSESEFARYLTGNSVAALKEQLSPEVIKQIQDSIAQIQVQQDAQSSSSTDVGNA